MSQQSPLPTDTPGDLEKVIAELRSKAAALSLTAKLYRDEALEIANGNADSIRYFPEARTYVAKAEVLEREIALLTQAVTALEGLMGERDASAAVRDVLSEMLERRTLALEAAEARATAAEAVVKELLADVDVDALEGVATAASHGPWKAIRDKRRMYPWRVEAEDGRAYVADIPQPTRDPHPIFEANAAHIAAFDPPTVLKLIAAVRAALSPSLEGGGRGDMAACTNLGGEEPVGPFASDSSSQSGECTYCTMGASDLCRCVAADSQRNSNGGAE